jgi:CTP synthase
MQLMSIELARQVFQDKEITSEEFDEERKLSPDKYIIHFLPGQSHKRAKGGTLRLGAYECKLKKDSKLHKLFGKNIVSERHRHRYEFNNKYRSELEKNGLIISGINEESNLVEMVEIENHPYMVGTQSHPEFLSRPLRPHPLFTGLIQAAIANHRP